MTPRTDVERLERLFVNALDSGSFERHGLRRGTWDVSRDCDKPVPVVMHSRATGSLSRALSGVQVHGIEIVMLTPCRRCLTCLRKKSRLWTYRAAAEIRNSERTWFGTLNTRPDWDVWCDHACATRERNFWSLSPQKKFAARASVMGIEVTKYLKRVRKNSGQQFRYLLVCEQHDSEKTSEWKRGRPHMHILLHEFAGQPVLKKTLDQSWNHGFSQWRLTRDLQAAWYVSKYISKAMDVRTRASIGYGGLP